MSNFASDCSFEPSGTNTNRNNNTKKNNISIISAFYNRGGVRTRLRPKRGGGGGGGHLYILKVILIPGTGDNTLQYISGHCLCERRVLLGPALFEYFINTISTSIRTYAGERHTHDNERVRVQCAGAPLLDRCVRL